VKGLSVAASVCLFVFCALGRCEDNFLGVSFGARAQAMGGAFSAVSDDSLAVLWNPAGLGQLDRVSLAGSQNHLSFTDNVFALMMNVPAGRWGTFAVSSQQLTVEDVSVTRPVLDSSGNPVLDPATNQPLYEITGFGRETDGTFMLGYGFSPLSGLLLGGTGKILVGNSAKVLGCGYGANTGMILALPWHLQLGLVAEDIGRTTVEWKDGTRTRIRTSGRAGLSWSYADVGLLSVEGRSPVDRLDSVISLGAEWRYAGIMAFRIGCDDWRLTGGAGFRMPVGESGAVCADYAFVTGDKHEDRNRLTITVIF
jgi:hypothetical protein